MRRCYCEVVLTFSRDRDADFWKDFIATYWEREPVLMRADDPAPPLTCADVFDAVTHMPTRGGSDRFWLARSPNPTSIADFARLDLDLMGPQPSDGDFEGFFARMTNHSFGINIHALGRAVPSFAALTSDVAKALSGAPGPVPTMWQSDTFFGNYRATPFGIHRDAAGVFSFTLMGHRTYYTWPAETFEPDDPDLRTLDPDVMARRLPEAERFDVGPGSLVYWPSNRWHLVASPGQPFVVAQVSAYFAPEDVGQA